MPPTLSTPCRYQGEYVEDLPSGHGIYLFASGQTYEGEWSNGKKHGWSIYTVDNGQQFVGQWIDSKPQWIQVRGPWVAVPAYMKRQKRLAISS